MYRERAIILAPRWGISTWKKIYVRVARIFTNLRDRYSYQREYNQYLRNLDSWKRDQEHITFQLNGFNGNQQTRIRRRMQTPMPLPPPVKIME